MILSLARVRRAFTSAMWAVCLYLPQEHVWTEDVPAHSWCLPSPVIPLIFASPTVKYSVFDLDTWWERSTTMGRINYSPGILGSLTSILSGHRRASRRTSGARRASTVPGTSTSGAVTPSLTNWLVSTGVALLPLRFCYILRCGICELIIADRSDKRWDIWNTFIRA